MSTSTLEAWSAVEQRLCALASPGTDPGLACMERLMKQLECPADFPAIHVAGTNGKGSVCACLDSMLRFAGCKTALYTSPHLTFIGERLCVGGEPLSPEKWNQACGALELALEQLDDCRLNYFQLLTAAAFWLIQRENVDAAIIETGLGGRLDATNIIPRPLLSIITPLGMDHTELLGGTLEQIAFEKFGIIKAGSKALYCGGSRELNEQFYARCRAQGTQGEILSQSCSVSDVRVTLDGSSFCFSSPRGKKQLFTRLVGTYQPCNAALAVRALELLSDTLPAENGIEIGLRSVLWPGRMEVIRRNPDMILDGAHNPHGVRGLISSLNALYGQTAPLSIVYASMADKDYMKSLSLIAEAFPNARLFCTELEGNARCESACKLAERAGSLKWKLPPAAEPDMMNAIKLAAAENNPVILCGSLYFIGCARMRLLGA